MSKGSKYVKNTRHLSVNFGNLRIQTDAQGFMTFRWDKISSIPAYYRLELRHGIRNDGIRWLYGTRRVNKNYAVLHKKAFYKRVKQWCDSTDPSKGNLYVAVSAFDNPINDHINERINSVDLRLEYACTEDSGPILARSSALQY